MPQQGGPAPNLHIVRMRAHSKYPLGTLGRRRRRQNTDHRVVIISVDDLGEPARSAEAVQIGVVLSDDVVARLRA